MGENIVLRGELKGHFNWVTAIATTDTDPNTLVTASRDRSIIVWKLASDGETLGQPLRRLKGHSHFVSDITLSSDGQYCLSGSWDGTLRLWDLATGETTRQFTSHTKDVLSVAFSVDNRQIVSGSRDKTVKLWNTIGACVRGGRPCARAGAHGARRGFAPPRSSRLLPAAHAALTPSPPPPPSRRARPQASASSPSMRATATG